MRYWIGLLPAAVALAAPVGSPKVDFDRDIRPILSDRCFACHGPDEANRKAGLRLDTKAGAFAREGVISPGKPEQSRLMVRVQGKKPPLRMPPVGDALTVKQVDLLREWISEGARWEAHWAYVPPQRPAEPDVRNAKWPRNSIDRFVLAKLEKEGLGPSLEADRRTLLRRASFDLTGLPPTPEEVRTFLADKSPDAFEKQVDRLLATPQYGERMAMLWLDLARYADSHGYHIDSHRDMWRWRDWVIQSFNRNQRFDQFVLEQLAGDLLPNATNQQILATGFNRNHMINFEGGAIPEEYQNEYVVDRVDTTATVFLGMTMGCARCHDHKYDPIRQKEFYQFAAFFNNIPEKGLDGQKGNAEPLLLLPTEHQAERQKYVEARIPEVEKLLKAKEVQEAYEAWQTGAVKSMPEAPRDALLAHYEMEGGFADSSGHYRHGRSLRDDGSFPQTRAGGGAVELSGRSEVELASLPWPKTLALWFQTRARTGRSGLLARMDSERRGWEIFLDDPFAIPRLKQKARFVVRKVEHWPDRVWEARLKTPVVVRGRSVDAWFHLAFSGDRFYLNGKPAELEVTKNTLSGPFQEVDAPVTIGGRQEADRLRGRVDDIRFYDRELSAEEIRALFEYEPLRATLAMPAAKRSKDQEEALFQWYESKGAPAATAQLAAELRALKKEQDDLEWEIPSVMVMQEDKEPHETYLLARGDYRNKTERVYPGVPAALPPLPEGPPNRLTLAKWLVSPDHPLTSRVAVNRFWQMVFGMGLVKTSEDFGSQGDPPANRELLDWLATEFVRSGWDVKGLMRLMVTSAAYRQSSILTPELHEKDPENRLLARGPRFRLPAEMVRDNALQMAGLLNKEIGGPSVEPYQPPGLWEELAFGAEFSAQTYQQSHGKDLYRRSMYTFWKRTSPPTTMSTFDAPDREKCTARRPLTNTPLQALALMNDATYVEAARVLAARVISEAGAKPARRLDRAFELALARYPKKNESALLIDLAKQKLADYRKDPEAAAKLLSVGEYPIDPSVDKPELAAWTTVMSVLLNLDETITKE